MGGIENSIFKASTYRIENRQYYELYRLEDSYHTEGFFKRESSLYKQLVLA